MYTQVTFGRGNYFLSIKNPFRGLMIKANTCQISHRNVPLSVFVFDKVYSRGEIQIDLGKTGIQMKVS